MRIDHVVITAAAVLLLGGPPSAQNMAAPAPHPATKTMTPPHGEKKPLAAPKVTQTTRKTTTTATRQPTGRVVTAKTTTGKTVNYDCGKAGNKTKKACKG